MNVPLNVCLHEIFDAMCIDNLREQRYKKLLIFQTLKLGLRHLPLKSPLTISSIEYTPKTTQNAIRHAC
jgi:hypothetical protein